MRVVIKTGALWAALALSLPVAAGAGPPLTEWTSAEEARGYVDADLPLRPVPPRLHEQPGPLRTPIVRRLLRETDQGARSLTGSLTGASVYLSPGHGWVYSSGSWSTQRPNLYSINEDLSNSDGVGQFLVPLLLNAGAHVVPVREIDPNTNMVILDNSDGAKSPARGKYSETGNSTLIGDSTLKGWGHPTLPLTGSTNPFQLGGNRLIQTTATETARATFVLNVPADGHYHLYVSYSMYSGRPSDARYRVVHPGGTTTFLVNQRRHGGTWVLLGRFYFQKGTDEKKGAVVVSNQSADSGSYVSADAVRLGGGLGLTDRGSGVSTFSRADECSRYHAQFSGAPTSVYDYSTSSDRTDDVGTRSRFADWVHAPGEPAIYFSHHSNAGGGQGTSSFIYGPNAPNGTYNPTATTIALGGEKLVKAVHTQVVSDIRAGWDSNWKDRKMQSAYFGELSNSNQDEMASMLIEIAFHDLKADTDALKELSFRRLYARAIYKGITKYFADKAGKAAVYLPEPPTAISARASGAGQVTVSWSAPKSGGVLGHAATSYRVYRGEQGYAFDNGSDSGGKTSLVLKGLKAGVVHYLRVAAVNAGGESLPTPTLAVKVPAGGATAPALLVSASDRADAAMNPQVTYTKLKTVDRLFIGRINSEDYLVQHGRALAGTKLAGFDACTGDAVEGGAVNPGGYKLVVWQAGRGVKGGDGISAKARAALDKAATAGVSMIISGARVARTLGGTGADSADKAFLARLGATFGAASSLYTGASALSGGALAGVQPWTLGTLTSGPYEVGIPDTVKAAGGGGSLTAQYKAGMGAATQQRAKTGPCGVLLAHPLEATLPAARHGQILSRLVTYCLPSTPSPDGAPAPDGPLLDGSVPGPDTSRKDGKALAPDGKTVPQADGAALELVLYGGSGCAVHPGTPPSWAPYWAAALLLILLVTRRRLVG